MTAPRTPVQILKAAGEVYALAQAPQVTHLRAEHPLLKQLQDYARVLYRYSLQDDYAPFAALPTVTGSLFEFVRRAGATLLPLSDPFLWDAARDAALRQLAQRLTHQGQTHLATYLTAAHTAITRLRAHGGAPLADAVRAHLSALRRSPVTGATGVWRQRRVAVVITQRAFQEHIETALQAHAAQIHVTTAPSLQTLQTFDGMIALGFSSEFPPSLFTAPRAPTLVLAQYAAMSDLAEFGGLYSATPEPLHVDVAEQRVAAPDELRALRLPPIREDDLKPRLTAASLTPAQQERAGEQEEMRERQARLLEQLREDLAFLNDEVGETSGAPSAAAKRAVHYEVAPGAWSAPNWEVQATVTLLQLTPDAPGAERTAMCVELDGGREGTVYAFVDSQGRNCATVLGGARAQVLYVPASQLGAGDYLLLRTQGGAQRAREMAATAGGDGYARAKALRDDWHLKFKRLVNRFGEQAVLKQLNGSDVLYQRPKISQTTLRRWYNEDNFLRPDDDIEFEALLEVIGIPVCGPESRLQEFMDAMKHLHGTHVSAGHHVADELLDQAVNGADVSTLIEHGCQTFTLGDGSGAFTAYRVLRIGQKQHAVPITQLARPLSQETS